MGAAGGLLGAPHATRCALRSEPFDEDFQELVEGCRVVGWPCAGWDEGNTLEGLEAESCAGQAFGPLDPYGGILSFGFLTRLAVEGKGGSPRGLGDGLEGLAAGTAGPEVGRLFHCGNSRTERGWVKYSTKTMPCVWMRVQILRVGSGGLRLVNDGFGASLMVQGAGKAGDLRDARAS